MVFGLLGLESQLIGHFKRLAEGQNDLIGQVLWRKGKKTQVSVPGESWPRKQHRCVSCDEECERANAF